LINWLLPPGTQEPAFAYAASLARGFREGGLKFSEPSVRRRPKHSKESSAPMAAARESLVVL